MEQLRSQEIREWEKRVVVKSTNFVVDKTPRSDRVSNLQDKFKGILQQKAEKIGLKLSRNKVRQLTERQIVAEVDVGQPC